MLCQKSAATLDQRFAVETNRLQQKGRKSRPHAQFE